MKLNFHVFCAFLIFSGNILWAQEGQQDPLEKHTFTPEVVMQHQRAIGLSGEQKQSIKEEIQSAQSEFTDLQWELEEAMETFVAMLSRERIDEQKALQNLDVILKLETEIKRTHLVLAIRIKNVLSSEQQAMLLKLRRLSRKE